jgi:hypothetical protein
VEAAWLFFALDESRLILDIRATVFPRLEFDARAEAYKSGRLAPP